MICQGFVLTVSWQAKNRRILPRSPNYSDLTVSLLIRVELEGYIPEESTQTLGCHSALLLTGCKSKLKSPCSLLFTSCRICVSTGL